MARAVGPSISLGQGDYMQLSATYSFTTSAIKVKPEVFFNCRSGRKTTVYVYMEYNGNKKTRKSTIVFTKKSDGSTTFKTWKVGGGDWLSIPFNTVKIRAVVGGVFESKVTITSDLTPAKPNLTISYKNDNRIDVLVKHAAQKGVRTATVDIERRVDVVSDSWSTVKTFAFNTNVAYEDTYIDQQVERGHRYQYRAVARNGNGNSGYVLGDWRYTNAPDVSNVSHVRNSNTTNTISFTRDGQSVDRKLFSGFRIGRKRSEGAWATCADIGPGGVNVDTVTFVDDTCSPDNYYSYRVRPKNDERGYSPNVYDEGGTEPTYNTPAAPLSITATLNSSGNGVLLLDNKPRTATELYIERSDDAGETWTALATLDETDAPVTAYTDTTGISGENVQYRARNARDDLALSERYSAWAYSNVIVTLSPPSAPTLVMPYYSTPVSLDNGSVRLGWIHNPNDGTSQTAAQIQYLINDVYHTTVTLTTAAYYDLTLDPAVFSANDQIKWRVRTKGADADYSEWSEYSMFNLVTKPVIEFISPENSATIEQLPIELSWTYTDDSGLLESLTLDILRNGNVEKTIDLSEVEPEAGVYSYQLSEFLFENNADYELRATAVSDTGLSSVDIVDIYIDYAYVVFQNSLFADAEFDEETGIATITLSADEAEPSEGDIVVDSPIVNAYLYRIVSGKRELVSGNLVEGSEFEDKYVPVNVPVTYELLEIAQNGQIALVTMEYTFESIYWYVYYGDKLARAIYDPSGSVSVSRPEKEQVRYSGRKYPVTYDSMAIEETFQFSGVTDDRDELNNFIEMIREGGQGVWKSADGDCYAADFGFSYSSEYTQDHLRWSISLDVTRIDGEV